MSKVRDFVLLSHAPVISAQGSNVEIGFPESLLAAHKGPRFGIEDPRRILGVYDRPLVGTIVKPKVGLDPAGTAAVAAAAVRGGLDQVKEARPSPIRASARSFHGWRPS